MRLELTLCKEVIRNKFNIDDRYNQCRTRSNKHTLVLSDELLDIYEKDAEENKYQTQFESWYFSLIGSAKKLKKVELADTENQEKEGVIVSKTAIQSKDKIAVGHIEKSIAKHFKEVYFVEERILLKDSIHTITIGDIKDVWDHAVLERIFDIYETPIRIDVKMGEDSTILGRYLALFYKESKHITIKDTYIQNNENNLNKYVLQHIDKEHVRITFRAFWKLKVKEQLIDRFTNYMGYKTKVVIENKKRSHHSMIESNNYIIDLGYRLRVFGDRDDNKTEQEIINITRKQEDF